MTERLTLRVAEITLDPRLQLREKVDAEAVEAYAEVYLEGKSLPPVLVYQEDQRFWLVDGYHRVAAKVKASQDSIECEVTPGSFQEAFQRALEVNQDHGVRRTNGDKRRVVSRALENEVTKNWSDRLIAQKCGVSNRFVGLVRAATSTRGPFQTGRRIAPVPKEGTQKDPGGSASSVNGPQPPTERDPTLAWFARVRSEVDKLPLPGPDPERTEQVMRDTIAYVLSQFRKAGFQWKK